MDSSVLILARLGLSGLIWECPGSSGLTMLIQACLGSGVVRFIWAHAGTSGLVWACPSSTGLVQAFLGLSRLVGFGLGPWASWHPRTVKSSNLPKILRKYSSPSALVNTLTWSTDAKAFRAQNSMFP